MINIGLIPLDNRPCNISWLEKLSKVAGVNFISYPSEFSGILTKGADTQDMAKWLENNTKDLDYLIISADGLNFGGLVQSRVANIDASIIIKKLDIIKKVKKLNPDIKIYVYDTIMRVTITAIDNDTGYYWGLMNKYTELVGRVYFFNQDSDKEKLAKVIEELPSSILDTFLKARVIKKALNEYFITLVEDGTIDFLQLLQEDSMPYGLQQKEQHELENIIKDKNLGEKIRLYNGTDEGALILLAKAIVTEKIKNNLPKPKVLLYPITKEVLTKTYLFEDHPCINAIKEMTNVIGIDIVDTLEDHPDFIIGMYGKEKNINLPIDKYVQIDVEKDTNYYQFINDINNFIDKGYKVAFVDLLVPNGGHIDVLKDINYHKLISYSAWNTTSNTLGSMLAELITYKEENKELNQKFVYERVLDDCIYQYIARRKVCGILLKEDPKTNIFNLGQHYKKACELVKEEMNKYSYMVNNQKFEIDLPWQRMFEVDVNIK